MEDKDIKDIILHMSADIETLKITTSALVAFLTQEQLILFVDYCEEKKIKLFEDIHNSSKNWK